MIIISDDVVESTYKLVVIIITRVIQRVLNAAWLQSPVYTSA